MTSKSHVKSIQCLSDNRTLFGLGKSKPIVILTDGFLVYEDPFMDLKKPEMNLFIYYLIGTVS